MKTVIMSAGCVSHHGAHRINERIETGLNGKAKLELAKEAYDNGKAPIAFLETNPDLFNYLLFKQNKYPNRTLRLYEGKVFIFSLSKPHILITCYPFDDESFEKYKRLRRK